MKTAARRNLLLWPSRPSSGRFHGLGEIAARPDGLLAERIGARRLLGFRLERAWARSVGERVRAVTRPHEIKDRILVVDVLDAAWKRELERIQPLILARLAESLPERQFEAIAFRIRPDARPAGAGPG